MGKNIFIFQNSKGSFSSVSHVVGNGWRLRKDHVAAMDNGDERSDRMGKTFASVTDPLFFIKRFSVKKKKKL